MAPQRPSSYPSRQAGLPQLPFPNGKILHAPRYWKDASSHPPSCTSSQASPPDPVPGRPPPCADSNRCTLGPSRGTSWPARSPHHPQLTDRRPRAEPPPSALDPHGLPCSGTPPSLQGPARLAPLTCRLRPPKAWAAALTPDLPSPPHRLPSLCGSPLLSEALGDTAP